MQGARVWYRSAINVCVLVVDAILFTVDCYCCARGNIVARGPFEPGALLADDRALGSACYVPISTTTADIILLTSDRIFVMANANVLMKRRGMYHVMIAYDHAGASDAL